MKEKVMSYPRTGSRYISEDVFDEMPERIALLGQYSRFAGYAAGLDGTPLNRRSVNDGKVTDHHALIVTENLPGELSKRRAGGLRAGSRAYAGSLFGQVRERHYHRHIVGWRY